MALKKYYIMSILLTQKETALAIGVSPNTLSKWVDCPCVRIGNGTRRGYRYILEEVLAYLKDRQQAYQNTTGKEMEK